MGDRALIELRGSLPGGEFWSPSRLTPEDEASRAHHTEEGVWLQLISMVKTCTVLHAEIMCYNYAAKKGVGQRRTNSAVLLLILTTVSNANTLTRSLCVFSPLRLNKGRNLLFSQLLASVQVLADTPSLLDGVRFRCSDWSRVHTPPQRPHPPKRHTSRRP